MSNSKKHTLAIVDDHLLFASSLEKLINTFPEFQVLFKARHGLEMQNELKGNDTIPDLILLDINMPVMNGFETVAWLTENHPKVKVLALSVEDNEGIILKMIRGGAKGYFLKDIHPDDLKFALLEVMEKGYYYSERVTSTMVNALQPGAKEPTVKLRENELTFLQLACSEMTYKEIADVMHLSPKTIDGYRQELFNKLGIKNRVGLVIYALKNHLIEL
ncbi:response regulator transcription factor [Aureisphaera galaxeae]|uniref:response regulator n=1 Tax=Aureisphaera galaxeae TaxID=1538023 RepID=UPI00235076D8|nr:response regulator transcription factor [Aureisphaera galaxeae]MDC8004663.1 response regulator transcription factor [Aureisphaera galaxeae]